MRTADDCRTLLLQLRAAYRELPERARAQIRTELLQTQPKTTEVNKCTN